MLNLRSVLSRKLFKVLTECLPSRSITALYITGDKARENYVAIQPYMDFEDVLQKQQFVQNSIKHRKMSISLTEYLESYKKYLDLKKRIEELNQERDVGAQKLRNDVESKIPDAEAQNLKAVGKKLRNELKALKESFYPIEDQFIHLYLSLPNQLHQNCPTESKEKIIYRNVVAESTSGKSHLENTDLIHFIDNNRYYLMEDAALYDLDSYQALMNYFIDNSEFIASSNPDFVRAVLLEGNATPLAQYHRVLEENLKNKLNSAYLAGGGSFESFLALVAKLCVYPSILPLRLISSGRNYEISERGTSEQTEANLYTATQTNCIQSFVATRTAEEADQEMENILNLCINFYKNIDIPFRIVYVDASVLTPSESLRAVIEVYSPAYKRYIAIGHVSNYTDYVSKRILFSIRENKSYFFPHLVGGPLLRTSRLIAAMIENGIPLDKTRLLGLNEPKNPIDAIDEFKNIFK